MVGEGIGGRQRVDTWALEMTANTPLLPLELESATAASDLEPAILFAFRGEEAVATAVDTPISCLPSLPGAISSSF